MAEQLDNEIILKVDYKVSLERYLEFNFIYAEENFRAPRKKAFILGTIEIVVAILLFVSIMMQPNNNKTLFIIVDAILLCMGLYGIVFYKFIFPYSLKKSATKQYGKNEYLQNVINLSFYSNCFKEKALSYSNEILWQDIHSIKMSETLYMIMINEKQCVIIPKDEIGDRKYELEELLETVAKTYDKKLLKGVG